MARQDRVDHLRHDRLVVADDAGEQRVAGAQLGDQVVADFGLDGPARDAAAPRHPGAVRRGSSPWGSSKECNTGFKGSRVHGFTGSRVLYGLSSSRFCRIGGVAVVYAHRGGAKLRPENTLLAFDHGLSLGADGLEFDVHLSRDGVVVVHHDATLDRTTNGRGPRRRR